MSKTKSRSHLARKDDDSCIFLPTDKNMHTSELFRTAKLAPFARLFLLFLSLQSYRSEGSTRVHREEGYFSCKTFKVLRRENLPGVETELFFEHGLYKNHYRTLVSESFCVTRYLTLDILSTIEDA